jgi:murein DD-endopeptidase MepM/ murein hydrolase activator NlpD
MAGLRKPFKGTYPMTQGFGHVGNPLEPVGWREPKVGGQTWRASYTKVAGWSRFDDLHFGTDWDCPMRTPMLAMEAGEVVDVGYTPGRGRYVVVRVTGTDFRYRLQHLYRVDVKVGKKVARGDQLGLSGTSGASTGSHLHVEVWRGGQAGGTRYNVQRLMVGGDKADVSWIVPA